MAFEQKTWTDRLSEYPNRRQLTKSDGTTEIVEVARLEGTISQEGDAFSAENMNDLEQRVADEFATQNETLAQFIKYGELTGTLSASGNLSLTGETWDSKQILAAWTPEKSQTIVTVGKSSKSEIMFHVSDTTDITSIKNTSVKIAYLYIEYNTAE